MKRLLYALFSFLAVVLIIFNLGPKPKYPEYSPDLGHLDLPVEQLDSFIANQESKIKNIKPENASKIIWADSVRKTPVSIVYLHGFSASPMEGDPVHVNFAKRYGCNIYLPRLSGHGIDDQDSFAKLTPKDLIDSAKEALQIGQLIGERVIWMSTSTGSTLSVYLSGHNPKAAMAQIMFSPNIDLYDQLADVLTMPWGLELAKAIDDEYRTITDIPTEEGKKFWTITYRMEGLVALKYLIEETMTEEVFKKVTSPVYIGAFYKNEEIQDKVVSVDAMRAFYDQISTPQDQKQINFFPDAGHHVITSRFQSKSIPEIEASVYTYAEEILKLKPVALEESVGQ